MPLLYHFLWGSRGLYLNKLPDQQDLSDYLGWEQKGCQIAMHGYNHVYTTNNKGIVPLNDRSEFAGISYDKQAEKIRDKCLLQVNSRLQPLALT